MVSLPARILRWSAARERVLVGLALVIVVSIGLRLPFLSVPLITDEGGYAYVAHWLTRGAALYRDLWFDRPQAIFVLYAAQMALLGESTEAIRFGAALYNAAAAVALYALGSALRSRAAGLMAAALFAVGSASPAIEGFTANGELYMGLPVALSLLCAVRGRWVAAGALCALACAIKPTALATLVPPLGLLVWQAPGRIRSAGALALGGLLGGAPLVAHGVATDAEAYWYATVGFRVTSHSAMSAGGALLGDFMLTAPTAVAALAPLWLLAAIGAADARRTRAGLLAAAMLGGSFLGAAAGGHWFWHYYVGVVPAAALLGGLALTGQTPRWLTAGVLVSLVPALYFNARIVGPTPEQTSLNLYTRPAYVWSREIAAHVRANSAENETIYAAFAQADLYHLAGRRSAGRHLYWTEINRVPGALDEVMGAIEDPARRPKYVIEIDRELEQPGRAAAFWQAVDRHYAVERELGDFRVHRARER